MRVRADVGCFKRRKGVLSRNGASTTVSIENSDSERSLTETRLDETRLTVARTALYGNQELGRWCDRSSVDRLRHSGRSERNRYQPSSVIAIVPVIGPGYWRRSSGSPLSGPRRRP
jgi:hypothetical protein